MTNALSKRSGNKREGKINEQYVKSVIYIFSNLTCQSYG